MECSDGTLYTGVTSELEKRIFQHHSGSFPKCYTFNRRPLIHQFTREFDNILLAFAFEKQIKRWSAAKKKALINGDIEELKRLAKRKNPSSKPAETVGVMETIHHRQAGADETHNTSLI